MGKRKRAARPDQHTRWYAVYGPHAGAYQSWAAAKAACQGVPGGGCTAAADELAALAAVARWREQQREQRQRPSPQAAASRAIPLADAAQAAELSPPASPPASFIHGSGSQPGSPAPSPRRSPRRSQAGPEPRQAAAVPGQQAGPRRPRCSGGSSSSQREEQQGQQRRQGQQGQQGGQGREGSTASSHEGRATTLLSGLFHANRPSAHYLSD